MTSLGMNNKNLDYKSFSDIPRPGHADYTYMLKYGIKSASGGGRSSARETIGRVCAGAIAEKYLESAFGTKFISWVDSVGDISMRDIDKEELNKLIQQLSVGGKAEVDRRGTLLIFEHEEKSYYCDFEGRIWNQEAEELMLLNKSGKEIFDAIAEDKFEGFDVDGKTIIKMREILNFRCPHVPTSIKMIERVKEVKSQKDSIGGTAAGLIVNPPLGIGEPCFDKYEALLGMVMLSLPATKGFEIGSGFEGTKLLGSEHNDMFGTDAEEVKHEGLCSEMKSKITQLSTLTNNAGGTLGGISNGNSINFRVAVKPVSTISVEQNTCNYKGEKSILEAKGRHDP